VSTDFQRTKACLQVGKAVFRTVHMRVPPECADLPIKNRDEEELISLGVRADRLKSLRRIKCLVTLKNLLILWNKRGDAQAQTPTGIAE